LRVSTFRASTIFTPRIVRLLPGRGRSGGRGRTPSVAKGNIIATRAGECELGGSRYGSSKSGTAGAAGLAGAKSAGLPLAERPEPVPAGLNNNEGAGQFLLRVALQHPGQFVVNGGQGRRLV